MAESVAKAALLAVFVLALLSATSASNGYETKDFVLGAPAEYLRSDGGFESNWGADTDTRTLTDANLGTWILVMEPSTLRPPHFVNADMLMAVLQGRARAGIINDRGEETGVRSLKRGDIVALPRGYSTWILNNDTQQKFSMLGGVRPKRSPRDPSKWETFALVNGDVSGTHGVLHGFDKQTLAEAFNVETELIDKLRDTPDSGLLKMGAADLLTMEHELGMREQRSPHDDSGLIFNIDRAKPDYTSDFGQVTLLDSEKFPILKNMSLGAVKTSLKPGAMVLPHYDATSGMIGFVTAGRARIQVASFDGSTGADEEVGPGEAFVVPRFFPLAQKSVGSTNLEWIGFTTTACPRMKTVFLAGKKSVYRSVPSTVLAAATQIDRSKIEHWLKEQPETCIAGGQQQDAASWSAWDVI